MTIVQIDWKSLLLETKDTLFKRMNHHNKVYIKLHDHGRELFDA